MARAGRTVITALYLLWLQEHLILMPMASLLPPNLYVSYLLLSTIQLFISTYFFLSFKTTITKLYHQQKPFSTHSTTSNFSSTTAHDSWLHSPKPRLALEQSQSVLFFRLPPRPRSVINPKIRPMLSSRDGTPADPEAWRGQILKKC